MGLPDTAVTVASDLFGPYCKQTHRYVVGRHVGGLLCRLVGALTSSTGIRQVNRLQGMSVGALL